MSWPRLFAGKRHRFQVGYHKSQLSAVCRFGHSGEVINSAAYQSVFPLRQVALAQLENITNKVTITASDKLV